MAKKLTKSKAKKILHDKEVHGHPLTEQQRKFFGAIASGAEPYKAQAGISTGPDPFVTARAMNALREFVQQNTPVSTPAKPAISPLALKQMQAYMSGVGRGDMINYPQQIAKEQQKKVNIKAAEKILEQKRAQEAAPKPTFLSADNRSELEREEAQRRTQEILWRQHLQNHPFVRTMASGTPGGNPAVGLIGAESTSGLITAVPQSASNLVGFATGQNVYGDNTFDKVTGVGLDLLNVGAGAASMVPAVKNLYKINPLARKTPQFSNLPRAGEMIRHPFQNKMVPIEEVSGNVERFYPKNVEAGGPGYPAARGSKEWKELSESGRFDLMGKEKGTHAMVDLVTDVEKRKLAIPTSDLAKYRLETNVQGVPNWLMGYPKAPNVATKPKIFKSEIDWAKWNPETPNYPELINEYNAIEESTKRAGTWMTQPRDYSIFSEVDEINLNGLKDKLQKGLLSSSEEEVARRVIPVLENKRIQSTVFQGSPEQFIQQQSSWFKKAFPEGAETTYRGTYGDMNTENLFRNYPEGRGVFTGDINTAQHYTGSSGKVHELYHPKGGKSFTIDVGGRSWKEVPVEGLPGIQSQRTFLGKPVATTDEIAAWAEKNNVDYVTMKNIFDGIDAKYSRVVNIKPGNFLKSTKGNVGFFDMTNPNIYKAVVPTVIGTSLLQQNENPPKKQNGGWLDKYDAPKAQNGIEGTMGGLTDVGFNYNGAWGGTMQMGGVLPGAVGFTYARTQSPAPANGPYAKKTKASAQDGKKLSYGQWKKQYNLKETPDYNLKRAWELGYTPDKTGHLPTVDNQTGQFLKAKGHPTLQLELDWYNSPEAADFRSKNAIDSSGKFFKYVPKGQNGQEMKYYQEGLDFKPKTISQDGSEIPVDPMGYWNPENVGNPVTIPSNIITMEGVDQPLLGISDTGDVQYMEPGEDYEFDGEYVTEYPMAKKGISVNNADAQPLKKLDQLLNFTNYNKPTKGGWLDKYN